MTAGPPDWLVYSQKEHDVYVNTVFYSALKALERGSLYEFCIFIISTKLMYQWCDGCIGLTLVCKYSVTKIQKKEQ